MSDSWPTITDEAIETKALDFLVQYFDEMASGMMVPTPVKARRTVKELVVIVVQVYWIRFLSCTGVAGPPGLLPIRSHGIKLTAADVFCV